MPAAADEVDVPIPSQGRTFTASRRIRLTDMDAHGRLRLDAVARFLQDVAIDDVEETGGGRPTTCGSCATCARRARAASSRTATVELVTWCSGVATIAAGRRWSVTGDRGGRIEVDSVWIHLDADQRPTRITDFAAVRRDCRRATRLGAPDSCRPADGRAAAPWPLRAADVDLHGHVNNTVYWQAVGARPDRPRPALVRRCARLEFREPLDLGDPLELVVTGDDDHVDVGFVADGRVKAVGDVHAATR